MQLNGCIVQIFLKVYCIYIMYTLLTTKKSQEVLRTLRIVIERECAKSKDQSDIKMC